MGYLGAQQGGGTGLGTVKSIASGWGVSPLCTPTSEGCTGGFGGVKAFRGGPQHPSPPLEPVLMKMAELGERNPTLHTGTKKKREKKSSAVELVFSQPWRLWHKLSFFFFYLFLLSLSLSFFF